MFVERRRLITARSILRAAALLRAPEQPPQGNQAQDPRGQIALRGFQRGPGQPNVSAGPAQGDQEPTEEHLQGARILDVA
eukprot:4454020-Alexandrium_andersonii.AAC.1